VKGVYIYYLVLLGRQVAFKDKNIKLRWPEAPSFNSHDREVVVMAVEIINEVRRTGMNSYRPFGPRGLFLVG